MKRCINPNCGAELDDNAKFCMECGTKQPQEYVCPACGAKFDQPSKFCMACGAKMDGTGGAPKASGMSIGDNNAISAKDIIGGDKIEAQNYTINNVMGPQKSEAELKMDNLSMKKMSKEYIREEMAKAKDFEKQGDYYHAVAIYKELDAEDNNDAACAILFLDYKKLFVVDNEERDTLLNKIRKAADEGHSEALFLIGVYTINSNKNMAFQYIERAAMNRFPTAIDYLDKYYGYNDDGTRKDVTEEAFRWFEKSAQMDSIQGQFLYADCYLNGYIVEKDPRKAAQVFRPLAEKGNPEFQYKMGKAMEDFGDDDEYEKWIKKSAEQGFMEAQLELANYYDNCGVDEMAHEWYKKAAEQGCAEAQYCYANGLEGERVQFLWYEKAALRDYAPAQSALGDCYYNGWGTFKDYKNAVQWYRKSAEQGNNRGQKGLGKCYYYGNGVECDYKEAIKWCTEATKGRYANEEAYYILGDCYFYGEGVEQNYEKAVELYEKAKDFPKAIYSLGFCYTEGLLGEENFKEGFKLFKKAAEKGYDQAQYRLARCYSDSLEIFVKKDDKEAFKWYKEAALQGHVFSMFKMFACYSSGIGVTKDENEAAKWAAYFKRTGADPLDGITYDHYKDWHDFERSKKNKTTQPKTNVTTPKPQPQPAPQPAPQPTQQPAPQPQPQPAAPAKTETSSGTVQVVLITAGAQKLFVVKEVKEYLNIGLKEAMDLVSDNLPNVIAELDENKAKEFYNILTGLGANVEIRTGGEPKVQPQPAPQQTKTSYTNEEIDKLDNQYAYNADGSYKGGTKESLEWFKKSAGFGSACGQYILGRYYAYGDMVEQNYSEAVKWFRKSAEQGFSSAQNHLGYCYLNGKGVEEDAAEAIKWFMKGAEQGHTAAESNVGFCYYKGYGVEKNYVEAIKWFELAGNKGDAFSQGYLGDCYNYAYGVKQDYEMAFKWYSLAADQNDAYAQLKVGDFYYEGKGREVNAEEAVKWYILAAEQGQSDAQNNLGYSYHYGIGIAQNLEEAAKWYLKAAEQGEINAMVNIGYCYQHGEGVVKDLNKAVEWYQKAADKGSDKAKKQLENIKNESKKATIGGQSLIDVDEVKDTLKDVKNTVKEIFGKLFK